MGEGKPRVFGTATAKAAALMGMAGLVGIVGLVGGCGQAASSSSLAPWQTPSPLTPTMTPSAVPVLGKLTFGTFLATAGGLSALQLCEDWAGLRAQYVSRVKAGDGPFQLEQWFSSAAWRLAFKFSSPLLVNPSYGEISVAFGVATTGQTASVAAAKRLDAACAAAD